MLSQSDWIAIIGVVVAIIAIIVAVMIAFKQRSVTELGYIVISDAPVLQVGDEIRGKVEVRFDGKVVTNLSLLVIRVQNVGNKPIQDVDYKDQIVFNFGSGSEVLNAGVVEKSPDNVEPSLGVSGGEVTLKPDLLNPKDFIEFSVLVTGYEGEVEGDARIIGGKFVRGSNRADVLSEVVQMMFEMTPFWVGALPLIGPIILPIVKVLLQNDRRTESRKRG